MAAPVPEALLLLKPEPTVECASCPKEKIRKPACAWAPKKPIPDVPHQVNRCTINKYRLVSSEIPLQPPYLFTNQNYNSPKIIVFRS
jgi:hypothetical protein